MTTAPDVLQGVERLGIDTAPFIYFVERHPIYVDRVRELFRRIDAGVVAGYSSVVTLTEVLTQPKQVKNNVLEQEYRSFLLDTHNLFLIDITTGVAERAAELRAQYRLRTPDAFQIAAALTTGCQAFLTNDVALRRVTDMRIILLDDLIP